MKGDNWEKIWNKREEYSHLKVHAESKVIDKLLALDGFDSPTGFIKTDSQSLTANGQVQMAPVQFDQCAAFAFVCKNRTESIHQQTLRKKQPLGA